MKWSYPITEVHSPVEVLRKAGYSYFRDPNTNEESYVIRLTSDFYPRFHLYVDSNHETVTLNLHLDQKLPSYSSGPKHSGEYEGPVVEKEMKRIDGWVKATLRKNVDTVERDVDARNLQKQKDKGQSLKKLWHNLFG